MSEQVRGSNGGLFQTINFNYAKIQRVSVSGTSAQTTNGMPHGCTMAMVSCDVDCFMNCAANPTAVADATSIEVYAKVYFYHPVKEGDKLAFIQKTSAGTAQVIPAL